MNSGSQFWVDVSFASKPDRSDMQKSLSCMIGGFAIRAQKANLQKRVNKRHGLENKLDVEVLDLF